MIGKNWFGWLRPSSRAVISPSNIVLANLLKERGMPAQAIDKAAQHRYLLHTRLASTLVVQNVASETEVLDALCYYRGLPGLCLRSSILDLTLPQLPVDVLVHENILPVYQAPDGVVVLACVDPIDEIRRQQLECVIGKPLSPHLVLHFHMTRTIQAVLQLRQECPRANYLVGDDVDDEILERKNAHLSVVIPQIAVPEYRPRANVEGEGKRRVLLATTDDKHAKAVKRYFADLDYELTIVGDGPTAMNSIARDVPDIIVLDAQLPGRSGSGIVRRLQGGRRYANCAKIVTRFAEGPTPVLRGEDDESAWVVDAPDIEEALDRSLRFIGTVGESDQEALAQQARLEQLHGLCAREQGNTEEAERRFYAVLDIDPLHGAAHLQRARMFYEAALPYEAIKSYRLAYELGAAEAEDVACLAELVQQKGDLRYAASLWQDCAKLYGNGEVAASLFQHARTLTYVDAQHGMT